MITPTPEENFRRFVREAQTRAEAGDDFAILALAAIRMTYEELTQPTPPSGGGNVIDLSPYRYPAPLRRAA